MGNSFFRFKQFTVEQSGSAMKVCTDACIQGAWTASRLQQPQRILDIGTGTGLLSLMLAQQCESKIDALELDASAFQQAVENFAASPWPQRLRVVHGDVNTYAPEYLYDLIISNPPFFEHSLKGPNQQRTAAMHTVTLTYENLLAAISRLLQPDGRFAVMLPYEGFQRFLPLAEASGYTLQELLEIQQTPAHGYFRSVGLFGKGGGLQKSSLTIYNTERQYTGDFTALLQPYYLYL